MRIRLTAVATSLIGALAAATPTPALTPGCRRAQETVDVIKREYAAGGADHKAVVERLRQLMQACPESPEVFRLAACSGRAVGDPRATQWESRAALNGATTKSCDDLGRGTAVAPRPAGPPPKYVRRKHALLIGIGAFADPTIPALQYPAKDAKDIARTLSDPNVGRFSPGNVTVLTDAQATRASVLDALQELILKAQEEDLVVLYLSSHGSPNRDGTGLAGVGYIVTHDTEKKTMWRDALEYRSFADKVSLIKARRKVLFLDTCYSGQASRPGAKALMLEGVGVGESTAKMFLSGEGTYVISSSRDNERSWESDAFKNGYFTHFLIQALRQGQEPPTIRQVFDHIARAVPETVAREKQEPQHPVMYPNDTQADVRIGVIPLEGAAPPAGAR